MNKQATIKDIAKTLKISTSTVSRALRGAPDVNKETRNAVVALSEELSYQPSRLALSLQQKQTHTINKPTQGHVSITKNTSNNHIHTTNKLSPTQRTTRTNNNNNSKKQGTTESENVRTCKPQ